MIKPETRRFAFFIFILFISHFAFADMTLEQVIQLSIKHHPQLEARQFNEMSENENARIARSRYYPVVEAMGLATSGFPGSAGATGIGGLMISPFHKGITGGLLVQQNIWDFGRTSDSVRLAEREVEAAQKDTLVSALGIGQTAQEIYYLCSRDRSLADVYTRVAAESELVEKEVENFVRVGQRSIVDKYLSKSQTEEVKTLAEDYKKRFQVDNQRLAYLIGQDDSTIFCPYLDPQTLQSRSTSSEAKSPLISLAESKLTVSQAQKSLAQKDYNPRVVGLFSAGWMDNTEFSIPKQNYSAAVGVIWPLFEGFKTSSQVKKYDLMTIESEKSLDATQFAIHEANLEFDGRISTARIRITNLTKELKTAETGFETAKKRYSNLQGNLIDLRESIRNLARTSSDLKIAVYEYATQTAGRALLNGQWNNVLLSYRDRPLH